MSAFFTSSGAVYRWPSNSEALLCRCSSILWSWLGLATEPTFSSSMPSSLIAYLYASYEPNRASFNCVALVCLNFLIISPVVLSNPETCVYEVVRSDRISLAIASSFNKFSSFLAVFSIHSCAFLASSKVKMQARCDLSYGSGISVSDVIRLSAP